MQPTTDKRGTVSAKSLFLRSRKSLAPASARTPVERRPIVPPRVIKPRKPRHSDPCGLTHAYGNRHNDKQQDPRVALADKLTESLDHYRETLHEQSTNDLGETEKKLASNLEELALDVEAHCHKLSEIEEPLQKPFSAEALTNVRSDRENAGVIREEVLLKESISEFRKLHEEKGQILRQLWGAWEDVQFEIVSLAVELYGKDSLHVVQLETGLMKPGQLERLHDTFAVAKTAHDKMRRDHAEFQQGLKGLEEEMGQISNKAKKVAKEIHESYVQKKTENLKQITTLLQQFTED